MGIGAWISYGLSGDVGVERRRRGKSKRRPWGRAHSSAMNDYGSVEHDERAHPTVFVGWALNTDGAMAEALNEHGHDGRESFWFLLPVWKHNGIQLLGVVCIFFFWKKRR